MPRVAGGHQGRHPRGVAIAPCQPLPSVRRPPADSGQVFGRTSLPSCLQPALPAPASPPTRPPFLCRRPDSALSNWRGIGHRPWRAATIPRTTGSLLQNSPKNGRDPSSLSYDAASGARPSRNREIRSDLSIGGTARGPRRRPTRCLSHAEIRWTRRLASSPRPLSAPRPWKRQKP